MNIFVLDYDLCKSAIYHCQKHIVKMPLESAQMLCTILNNNNIESPYKSCHRNHPCTLWAGKTMQNFAWLYEFGLYLCYEYTYRFNKVHKCEEVINYAGKMMDKLRLPDMGLTPHAQAMPDSYKSTDAVTAYRNYYAGDKTHLFDWGPREKPDWLR